MEKQRVLGVCENKDNCAATDQFTAPSQQPRPTNLLYDGTSPSDGALWVM
jgi:hypothetical protein